MIIVRAISTCFMKFSVIENVSICKCLIILTKSVQVYIMETCFLILSKIFFNTLKVFLLVPCLLYSVGVITFSDLSFWLKMYFVHSVLVLTSVVLVVSLWPSEEDKVTSLNYCFREFVDIVYHFYIIFSFKYTVWNNLRIFLDFNKALVFIFAHIFIWWCFEITLVIILFN